MFVVILSLAIFLICLAGFSVIVKPMLKKCMVKDINSKIEDINTLYRTNKRISKINTTQVKKARQNVEAFKNI